MQDCHHLENHHIMHFNRAFECNFAFGSGSSGSSSGTTGTKQTASITTMGEGDARFEEQDYKKTLGQRFHTRVTLQEVRGNTCFLYSFLRECFLSNYGESIPRHTIN